MLTENDGRNNVPENDAEENLINERKPKNEYTQYDQGPCDVFI